MKREWVRTKDNSQTLWVPELKQHYHSHHGAVQESRHVFLEAGLAALKTNPSISILEIGLGTGLNALLTYLEGPSESTIYYHGIEKYPLEDTEWAGMDPASFLGEHPNAPEAFKSIHQAKWNELVNISPRFTLFKEQVDLHNFQANVDNFDLIYFDAFSPGAQSDLWTEDVFKKMHYVLKPGGILVTYCVMGAVRRAMAAAGFSVTKIPGPPGKREMVRAFKA